MLSTAPAIPYMAVTNYLIIGSDSIFISTISHEDIGLIVKSLPFLTKNLIPPCTLLLDPG